MTTNRIAFAVIAVIIAAGFVASLFKIQLAQALADASSTDTGTTSQATLPDTSASTSSTTTTPAAAQTTTTPVPTQTAAPQTLKLVHTAGTKYVDYCTDGKKVTAYPGDPAIDAHFNVPNAATPKCPAGQTWDHTSGMDGYDTASADLDIGDYAQEADGSYIVHYAAMTYTDATSTSQWPDRIVTTQTDPTASQIPSAPATQTATSSQ